MPLNRYSKRRDANEGLIVDVLEYNGADVDKLDRPVDLLIGYAGVTVLAEVKGPRGKPTARQLAWLKGWKGGRRCVLRSVPDAVALLDELDAQEV